MSTARFAISSRAALLLIALLFCTGCWKKSGDAIVLEKEYLPAVERTPTPAPNESPTPSITAGSDAAAGNAPSESEADDQVQPDDATGPTVDPRSTDHEQWILKVELAQGGRRMDVRVEHARWDKLKIGDRVHVTYREGKYTGTVWSADLD
jgi:hypothetical protein